MIRPQNLVVTPSIGGVGPKHGAADRRSWKRAADHEPDVGAVQPSLHFRQLAFTERGRDVTL